LTAASQSYAESLAPLHQQLSDLRRDLDQAAAATQAEQRRLADLRAALARAVDQPIDEEALRALLGQAPLEKDE
jgi:hypothetical protein